MSHRIRRALLPLSLLFATTLLVGACRSAYYGTLEKFGIEKRDILVERVQEGREDQEEARAQFVTTFDKLKLLSDFDGGDLEDLYDTLKAELTRCEREAMQVRDRIRLIEEVADDLFAEWEKELEEIQNPALRSQSRESLYETQDRCQDLVTAMHRAERRMGPVLVTFNDHVLFLKHNLNAQAIASLQTAVVTIETDVSRLVAEMQDAIREADSFIADLGH